MKLNLKLITGVAFIFILSMTAMYQTHSRTSSLESLLMENIEALAGGESSNVRCIGHGTVDCPINHAKVEFYYGGFTLE